MTTVRLAFMRRLGDIIGVGCLLALATVIVISETDAASVGTTVLIAAVIVAVVTVGVPRTFWLREEETGLVVVRLLVAKHYAWSQIRGMSMEFHEETENGAHHVRLRLRLADPPGRHCGPFLGHLTLTDDDRPRGVEPRALAELFALFGRHGLPVDRRSSRTPCSPPRGCRRSRSETAAEAPRREDHGLAGGRHRTRLDLDRPPSPRKLRPGDPRRIPPDLPNSPSSPVLCHPV